MRLFVFLFYLLWSVSIMSCEGDFFPDHDEVLLEEYSLDLILDKAENYLLQNEVEQALRSFADTLDFLDYLESSQKNSERRLRANFGKLLSLSHFDVDIQVLESIVSQMEIDLCSYSCEKCEDVPILGPDRISIKECLGRVSSTERCSLLIVTALPIEESKKFLLNSAIILLAEQAQNCCRRGGVWKACLKPLIDKWRQLKVWENIGIPPDPMWD